KAVRAEGHSPLPGLYGMRYIHLAILAAIVYFIAPHPQVDTLTRGCLDGIKGNNMGILLQQPIFDNNVGQLSRFRVHNQPGDTATFLSLPVYARAHAHFELAHSNLLMPFTNSSR